MMENRPIPLSVSGDLHALGSGIIRRSGDLRLKRGVASVLSGPVSSSDAAWPSTFRGTGALVPSSVEVEERMAPLERNGFTIVDIFRDRISVEQFAIDLSAKPLDDNSLLEPVHRMSPRA